MKTGPNLKSSLGRRAIWRSSGLVLAVIFLAGCGSPEQRAQEYYESGMALIGKNDDLAARLELLKAVKYKSDKVEVWRALAGIDERTKANSLFLDLRRIVELDPNDIDARVKLARMMVAGGAAEPAIKILDAANEGDKPNAALHAVRALAHVKMNDPAAAIREAQRAYDIDPTNIDAVTLLASKKVAEGDSGGALKMLDAVPPQAQDADRLRATRLRIDILVRKGELAEAEKLVRQLMADYPQDASYRTQLIQILTAQRKFDDAEKELRARVAASPSDSKLGLDLVRFLNTFKSADAARTELESRIKSGGEVFDYKFALAELDFVKSRQSDAIAQLQKLLPEVADNPERKLKVQVRLAEMLLATGDKATAEPLISEVLSKDRRNAGALRLRAALSLDKGQTDSAIADLREALADQPKSPELLIALALAYEQSGKPELADRQYADALKNSNLNIEVALRYVAFLQRRSDAARAEDVLTEVVARYPGNLQALSSLAQVKLSRQNWDGALAIATTIAAHKDGRVVADQVKAAAYAGQQRIGESIAALEDARKAVPEAIQPAVALASAYIRAERAADAATVLQEMNKRYPDNAELLVMLGQTQLAQKKDQDAIASFHEAIKLKPKDPSGYSALSDYYVRAKNYDAASGVLQAGLKENPQNIALRISSAGLQILKNDNEAAISQYESILKDQPQAQSPIVVNNLASLLLDTRSDKGSWDRAAALAETLKASNVPQFQDTLGWARFRQGDIKSAITLLEPAAAKLPNLSSVHYHLGLAYAADGQAQKAKEELDIAAKLEPDGTELKKSIQDALKKTP